ncbi:uncharacterized protein G2W53_007256 [Senna tora]|uniref:Uncharacterized protein n=1 Tax=Senna tora TaxID=362788 RepID=A0A834X6S9_9FABA|nr:uncharacterized protein G2W53_007256 [Senna tora]
MEGERETGRRGRTAEVEITFGEDDVNTELISTNKCLVGRMLTSSRSTARLYVLGCVISGVRRI